MKSSNRSFVSILRSLWDSSKSPDFRNIPHTYRIIWEERDCINSATTQSCMAAERIAMSLSNDLPEVTITVQVITQSSIFEYTFKNGSFTDPLRKAVKIVTVV